MGELSLAMNCRVARPSDAAFGEYPKGLPEAQLDWKLSGDAGFRAYPKALPEAQLDWKLSGDTAFGEYPKGLP